MQVYYHNHMKRHDTKSHCPINYWLEAFGDPWSLLIVRDIVYFGKKTYGDFLDSEERIATNILASRLVNLQKRAILIKHPDPNDKRKEVYKLTPKGLDLIPALVELACWGAVSDPDTQAPLEWIAILKSNKPAILALIRDTVAGGGSVFVGPGNVISQLEFDQMTSFTT